MLKDYLKISLITCFGIVLLISLVSFSLAAPPINSTSNPISPIGTNLAGIVDWTSELPFTDIFKTSRTWITQCDGCAWDTGEYALLDLDEHGWVRSLPGPSDPATFTYVTTIMLVGDDRNGIAGDYIVLYEGEGTIVYRLGAVKDEAASTPGRDVINLPADRNLFLSITETDPNNTGNYIRNIRVVRPEDETTYQTQIFNPNFLEKVNRFNTVRYMDWMQTNGSQQGDWANRPLPTDAKYACYAEDCKGAPLEIMIELANQTQTEPWFTLPHQATDEYITQFATLVRDNLGENLRVYVEYSNEVWNSQFEQADWVSQQGEAEWPASSASNYTKRINWYGKRTAEICDIWKTVFGPQSERVVCVMASQAANDWTASQALSCPLWSEAPCAAHGIDALAIAPYFGGYLGDPSYAAQVESWTNQPDGGLSLLFTEIFTGGVLNGGPSGGAIERSLGWVSNNKTVADSFGLDLIAYEGGQHLVGHSGNENNQAITNLFISANRDPRMYDAYIQYLNGWRDRGGQLFANFSLAGGYSKWGSWGVLEYINQPSAPKYDALLDFIENNPCWWDNCTVQTTDLSASRKSASASTAQFGDTVTYTVTILNRGMPFTHTVRLTDTLPTELSYIPGTLTTTWGTLDDDLAPTLRWSGTLSDTSVVTLTYAVTVTTPSAQVITNTAQIDDGQGNVRQHSATILANAQMVYLPAILKD